jgi:hypothetical protein
MTKTLILVVAVECQVVWVAWVVWVVWAEWGCNTVTQPKIHQKQKQKLDKFKNPQKKISEGFFLFLELIFNCLL